MVVFVVDSLTTFNLRCLVLANHGNVPPLASIVQDWYLTQSWSMSKREVCSWVSGKEDMAPFFFWMLVYLGMTPRNAIFWQP